MTPLSKPRFPLIHILFFLYCLFIVWGILFKLSFSFREITEMIGSRSCNFIPFYYECDIGIRFQILEISLNALLFLPFGVYLKLLDIPSGKAVLTGVFFSFALELCQFLFALGVCDITDFISNTAGTAAGVSLYLLALKLFKNPAKLNRILSVLALTATILLGILLLLMYLANR